MKRRRSKSLEKIARAIKDTDEFVEHIFGVAAAYRTHNALEASAKGAEIRKALKVFDKHASALNDWLRQALKQTHATAEHEALNQLSTALHGSPVSARAQAQGTQLWLASVSGVSERALQALKRSPVQRAPLAAAEALRSTFAHHGLKISLRGGNQPSDAIRLFCAIAKDANDVLMTPERARECLKSKVSD